MKKRIWIATILFIIIAGIMLVLWGIGGEKVNQENERKIENEELGEGLTLLTLRNEQGVFVEDGSDMEIESVGTAVIRNDSNKTLQLARISIELNEEVYEF